MFNYIFIISGKTQSKLLVQKVFLLENLVFQQNNSQSPQNN